MDNNAYGLFLTKGYKMTDTIRGWYMNLFPQDELGSSIPKELTFNAFLERLGKEDAYKIIDVGDSIVRERVFLAVSTMAGIDYEELWDKHNKTDPNYDKMMEIVSNYCTEHP